MKRRLFLLAVLILIAGCSAREPVFRQLNGDSLSFSEFRGKVVLVNYWAIWCKPCREEIPALNRLQKKFPDQVKVLGVNFDRTGLEELFIHANSLGIEFTVLLDDPRKDFDVTPSGVLPETLVIDTDGKLRQVLLGPQTDTSLELVLSQVKNR